MILIDALFINKGGGAVLLEYLVEKILAHPQCDNFFFLLDPRFKKPALLHTNFEVIPNNLRERKKFYQHHKDKLKKVFCFANTPPPMKIPPPVYTYFHNQKILEAPAGKFKREHFRTFLKYLLVKRFNPNTDYYIVQTPHMKEALTGIGLKDEAHCLVYPFFDDAKYRVPHRPFHERPENEFVFIANPSPQKNYPVLLDAWEHLLQTGHKPALHVTIDGTAPQLQARAKALREKGCLIHNHVRVVAAELYFRYPFLIFPSLTESFGLPLAEAAESGMKILASDLPYVYDVVSPSLTFNTHDKVSIADAVVRAMTSELPFPDIRIKNEVDSLLALLVQ